jgi:hypothetical protein
VSAAWSPWQQGNIEIIEKVQEKAQKQTTGLASKTNEEKSKEVGMDTPGKEKVPATCHRLSK